MGVTSGSKLCYQLGGLTLSDVCSLACKRAESVGRPGFPAVASDVSWHCYTCHHSTVVDTVKHVIDKTINSAVDSVSRMTTTILISHVALTPHHSFPGDSHCHI